MSAEYVPAHVKTYLRLGDFSESLDEASFVSTLRNLPLRQVLLLLADINHHCDLHPAHVDVHYQLAQALLPTRHIRRAERLIRTEAKILTYPQITLNLGLRALLFCEAELDPSLELDETQRRQVGMLILAEADRVNDAASEGGSERESFQSVALEIARSDLMTRSYLHGDVYEDAYQIYFQHLPQLPKEQLLVDPEAVFFGTTGMHLGAFWALGAFIAVSALTNEAHRPVFPSAFGPGDLAEPDLYGKWTEFWSLNLLEARHKAAQDLKTTTGWAVSTFFDKPILVLDDETAMPMRTMYLAEKASPNGLCWLVRDLLSDPRETRAWLTTVGYAFHSYMHERIRRELTRCREIVLEDDMGARWGEGKKCDAVAIFDERAWICMDFVYRNPTLATKVTGTYDDFVEDLDKTVLKKLGQIDETISRALTKEKAPKRIYPVVVVGGQFPLNPLTQAALSDEIAAHPFSFVGTDSRCAPPVIIESLDFRQMLDAANGLRQPAFRVLERWLASPSWNFPFGVWMQHAHPDLKPTRSPVWLEQVKEWLFAGEVDSSSDGA